MSQLSKTFPVLGAVQEAPVDGGNRTDNDPLDRFGLLRRTSDLHIDLVEARGSDISFFAKFTIVICSNFLPYLELWGRGRFPKVRSTLKHHVLHSIHPILS